MKSEKEIVEEVKMGMASAFDKLYNTYSHKLYYFAFSILKSKEDAEEVVQNTFFKIWEKRYQLDNSQVFKSYLFTVAYNIIIDLFRERVKEKKFRKNVILSASINYNLEESIEFGDLIDRVNQIVEELPPRKNEIYKLSRLNNLSHNEIAQKLNISTKTVENSINYSLNFIKKRLGKDTLVAVLFAALFL